MWPLQASSSHGACWEDIAPKCFSVIMLICQSVLLAHFLTRGASMSRSWITSQAGCRRMHSRAIKCMRDGDSFATRSRQWSQATNTTSSSDESSRIPLARLMMAFMEETWLLHANCPGHFCFRPPSRVPLRLPPFLFLTRKSDVNSLYHY